MRIPYFDLRRQYELIKPELQEAMDEVFAAGQFVMGRQLAAFESELASYLGVEHAIGVASGTDAIWLGLIALGVESGDEVVTAANTAFPTVAAICKAGATPVLADIDLASYNIDVDQLSRAITKRTKVLLPVHLYGQAAYMEPIVNLARERGIKVLEDACQAHGARYRGRKVGSLTEAAAFSFYPTKNVGAYGDAGAVATSDAQVAARVRGLRDYGQRNRYDHQTLGFNSRLDELQAAILRVKLRHLDEWNAIRRGKAGLYNGLLRGVVTPEETADAFHVFHLYVIRHQERDALRAFLTARGIGTLIHYPRPVHLQPAYASLQLPRRSLPRAEQWAREVLSLPLYPELSDDDVAVVAEAVNLFSEGL